MSRQDPIAYDVNPNGGNWVLGEGWAVVAAEILGHDFPQGVDARG